MTEEADTTFQKVFSQKHLTDSVKLLPSCISSAIPLPYMSKVLATTAWQREDVPVTTTTPEPEGSQALASSGSPAHWTGTPPLPVPLLQDTPFVGTPPVAHPFAKFIVSLMQKKQDCSSSGTPCDQHNKWTHIDSQVVKVRSEHSSTKGDENMTELALEARLSSKPQGQEPTSPPSSPTKATADPGNGTVVRTLRSTGDQDSESNANNSRTLSDSDTSRENVADSR